MAARHFSDIGFLRCLDFELLLTFLRQFEGYLTQRRSLELNESLLAFRYHQLAEILLTPDTDMPVELIEGFYLVRELSQKASMETLCRHLKRAEKFPSEQLPIEDLLLLTLTEAPDILDYVHAELYLVRPKKFETFFCRSNQPLTISDDTQAVLEAQLNEWFSTQRKGRGVRIFRFVRPDGIWFLIQHGKQIKCDFTHEDNGDSRRIIYRPGTFDVLCFRQDCGELRMHTATKKDRDHYRRLFGGHFFQDENFFHAGDGTKKYSLDPLKSLPNFSLACFDVTGIKSVELTELQLAHKTIDLREVYHSDTNLLNYLDILAGRLTDAVNIVRATFRLTFDGDAKSRCVTICTPNVTIYDREADGVLVDLWLKSKGLLVA